MAAPEWTTVIRAKTKWFSVDLKELIRYKGLIGMFVKRYFSTMYKQTILGPLWIVINPFLTTVFFTVIFSNIAQLSTDGMPALLFYMAGNTMWALFAFSLNEASSAFISNSAIFGKVYFPRLTAPLSTTICGLINFLVQFCMFLVFYFYYLFTGADIRPNAALLLIPVLVVEIALLGMGIGLIVSALTTKYKDLKVLVAFAVQLWMYATPIVYPLSSSGGLARIALLLNPVTPIVEAFRYAFTGVGTFSWPFLCLSFASTAGFVLLGVLLFNRTEKTFVDTI